MNILILDAINKSVTVAMGGAAATTNPDWTSHWSDDTGASFTEGSLDGVLAGAAQVTVVSSPAAATRRIIKEITIHNRDTAPVTLTIRFIDGANQRVLQTVSLGVSETFTFCATYDSIGNERVGVTGAVSLSPTSAQFSALSNQVSVADAALSVAINVVSNNLSQLISLHDVLSNRVSANSGIGGGGSVTSTELSAVSAQANSAIDVVSNAVSNEASVRASADLALSNAISVVSNVLSNEISARAASVQTASAAATSADNHANTVSARVVSVSAELASLVQIASAAATSADAHANTVSARVVSVSAELASLVQIASAAATSADGHANTASAAATSVDARVNSVNTFISGISARSVGNVSTHGFQSVVNALSGRIDAVTGGSVTSNELSAVSAQAASAIQVVSNAVSVEASIRLASVATLSLAVTSVDARVSDEISNRTSAILLLSLAVTSVDARVSNEISNRNSAVNVVSTLLSNTISQVASVNTFISGISARSVGNVSTHGLQSVIDALSNRISAVVGGTGSVTSDELSAVSAQAASAINVVSARVVSVSAELVSLVQIASAAATSVDGRVNSVNTFISGISARTKGFSTGGSVTDISTHGLQSVVNALSNTISNLNSAHNVLSTVVSNIISAGGGGVSVTSNDLSITLNSYSARNTAGTSVHGIQSIVNALSNRISAAGGASVTSQELSVTLNSYTATNSAGQSVRGLQSIINTLSLRSSGTRIVRVTAADSVVVSVATLTTLSGFSFPISAGETYEIDAMILYSTSAGSPNCAFVVEMDGAGSGIQAGGFAFVGTILGRNANASVVSSPIFYTWNINAGTACATFSILAPTFNGQLPIMVKGAIIGTDGTQTLLLRARCSAGSNLIVKPGTYMKVAKTG